MPICLMLRTTTLTPSRPRTSGQIITTSDRTTEGGHKVFVCHALIPQNLASTRGRAPARNTTGRPSSERWRVAAVGLLPQFTVHSGSHPAFGA